MKKEDLVDFYWQVERKRSECTEVTILEIAEEFLKIKNLTPQREAGSVMP